MRNSESFIRMRTLQVVVLLIFALIVGRLAYIQPVSYTHLTLPTTPYV